MNSSVAGPKVQDDSLEKAPVVGLIAKFAIPSIITGVVNSAYNITDQVFIGHIIGMIGNTATNVTFPITATLVIAFAHLIGVGTAANFNISLGKKKTDEAKKYIGNGITLMILVGLILMSIVLIFKTPILYLCGATEESFPYALAYLNISLIGIPFHLISIATTFLIRADGSPTYSMLCNIIGAGTNIFLDFFCMSVLDMGIQGAAVATVISQILSFVLCITYFFRFKSFKIQLRSLGIKLKTVLQIAKLGAANFITQIIMLVVNIVMNNTLKHYGALSIYGSDIPLAVSGVITKINSIMSAISVGVAQGCQPILGYNIGAKNYKRVKETYKKALPITLVVGAVALLLFQLFPRQIVSIFGTGSELYFEFAVKYMRIYMMLVIVFGIQPLTCNYFTGTGNARSGILLSLSRQGFFLVPLMIILPIFMGLNGMLISGPIADGLACIMSLLMIRHDFKRLDRLPNP